MNATNWIAPILRFITAYWLIITNIEITDVKKVLSPFLEVFRIQEETKLKTILFLLFLV